MEKNGWEVKYLKYSDLLLVDEKLRPYFMAEFLKSLGCRMMKQVAAPGDKAAAAAASGRAGGRRGNRGDGGGESEEAIEAGIVLRDPKASPRSKGPTSRLSGRR